MRARGLFPSLFSQQRILGGAAVLAVLQFSASLAGLIRDRVLARTFPELDVVDVYIAAFRPSDLLFQMCIMAGFSVALVPLLARYHASGNRAQMNDLLSAVMEGAALFFGGVAVVLAIIFPFIAPYLVGFEGQSLDLYVTFGRLALITNLLFVFGNAFGQYLITVQRYWIYGVTPVLYTLGTILGTVYLTPFAGAYGPMLGTLGGAVAYVLLRLAGVLVSGYRLRLRLWHPDLTDFGRLMMPRMLALGALQLQLLIFDAIASRLSSGAVTVNAYARNFQAVAVGIAGIALAQSAYSLLSQAAARGERKRFKVYLRRGVLLLLGLTIPGAVALTLLAPVAAWLVHLTKVLPVFSIVLTLYAVSIPFESINHLLLRAFYATKHTLTPALLSVVNGVAAIAIAALLSPQYGVYSLALGFAAGQIVQMIGLAVLLPRRVQHL